MIPRGVNMLSLLEVFTLTRVHLLRARNMAALVKERGILGRRGSLRKNVLVQNNSVLRTRDTERARSRSKHTGFTFYSSTLHLFGFIMSHS